MNSHVGLLGTFVNRPGSSRRVHLAGFIAPGSSRVENELLVMSGLLHVEKKRPDPKIRTFY